VASLQRALRKLRDLAHALSRRPERSSPSLQLHVEVLNWEDRWRMRVDGLVVAAPHSKLTNNIYLLVHIHRPTFYITLGVAFRPMGAKSSNPIGQAP
jgi:hypothetical protein